MQFVKMLKLILGGERAGRIARRTQMLIVLFTSGESFALVSLRTQWDKRTVATGILDLQYVQSPYRG